MLLEEVDAARARGARSYGEILGFGMTASKAALNAWPAEPSGIVRAMRDALNDAAIAADRIDAVFAAAHGSKTLDMLEARAIRDVFPSGVPVASLKGAIGESGAAGAAALAAGCLTLAGRIVPSTVGFSQPDPDCPVTVSATAQTVRGRTFLVNAVASGGTHYAIVARAT